MGARIDAGLDAITTASIDETVGGAPDADSGVVLGTLPCENVDYSQGSLITRHGAQGSRSYDRMASA